jgi:hypothetical protein
MRAGAGAGALGRLGRATVVRRGHASETLSHPKFPPFFFSSGPHCTQMSRLIVKNLPSYITPTFLKEHFSHPKGPHGTITDVKVIVKQDGAARRFGFVGFKTDEEALKAKEWYDKTFIDSTRVRVEVIDVGFLPSLPVAL